MAKPCPYCDGYIGKAHEVMCPNLKHHTQPGYRGVILGDAWLTDKQRRKKFWAEIPDKYQTNDLPPFLKNRGGG